MRKILLLFVLAGNSVFAQVNLNLGLRAYYPFNGNANDASGNNNNPVFNNATLTADRSGNPNSAYHFNGSNTYIKISNSSSLNMNNQMSIALWVKPTGFSTGSCYNHMMVMKGDNDNNPAGNYYIRFSDVYTGCSSPTTTQERFYGTGVVAPTPLVQLNQWYSVVWTYDGTTARIYVNCQLMQATTGSFSFTNSADLYMGHMNDVTFPYWLNGDLDEVRIYDRPLNIDEVKTFSGCLSPGAKDISGVINTYTPVLALSTDPCTNTKITVQDASTFNVGDTVMMIQMKGAVVDSTNTASFGNITDYKNAGNYEFNYIKNKTGNILEFTNIMTRQYDIPNGKVQLIRVPYYQSVNITSTLTCLPWDGSKGGVLVLNVQDTIYMDDVIDVSGKGFRGGGDPFSNPGSFFCYENQYYYPANPDLASEKGEGIAEVSASKSFGKGALANGGGGGNSHNAGGGGGSNGSTGGFGGYNFEGSPCNTTVPFDNRGIGGKTLTYSNAVNKIFLGGGGGAGHSNNPEAFQATGGNGSGIAIIKADKIQSNGYKIVAKGGDAAICSGAGSGCHEGMGGGGAGGTVLITVNNYINPLLVEIMGGKGGDMTASGFLKVGPGGGGSGGKLWVSSPSLPATVSVTVTGGLNGVCTAYGNDPWGATQGQLGSTSFNLVMPIDNIPFKSNIDSVRIKDSATVCTSFDFKGFGYTNTNPIASWQWYFGDGGTASTQNTSHTYSTAGTFTVKLVITDINGCKDSISKDVTTVGLNFDFSYAFNACNPLLVQFAGAGTDIQNPYWSFGDGNTSTGNINTSHAYTVPGTYLVMYSVENGTCTDTARKIIDLSVTQADIIATRDTTICYGTTKQLLATPSGNFCWTPVTYLNDPMISNPVTSTPENITYYYTAEITGTNLVTNADFSSGNSGFTSQYIYTPPPNTSEGEYYVGPNPQAWNAGLVSCTDHTTGSGNMLLVNGASTPNVKVWAQTVSVTPNTNYVFSTWLQHITDLNPAQLQFSVNGVNIGPVFQANNTSCFWEQFTTRWNSGTGTTAQIAIVNQNTVTNGNDFALDDIFFAPVSIKRDSVKITVDTARIATIADAPVCEGASIQLNTTGNASTYSWTPPAGLDNPTIQNPIASPVATTHYFVTGTTANGCTAKDSVWITVNATPNITKSKDTTICQPGGSAQLSVTGGGIYSWTPTTALNNASSPNPTATPVSSTLYYILVTGSNGCSKTDSVLVTVRSASSFSITTPPAVCKNSPAQLSASGGDLYTWTPSSTLNNGSVASPLATPLSTTTYTVQITDTICHNSSTLSTIVTVRPLPVIAASRSNDISCSVSSSMLSATGASSYVWSPAATLNNPNSPNPIATPGVTTLYTVTGTDDFGCSNTGSVNVKVDPNFTGNYLMPTAFTPNNDGKNDCYGVKYWGTITKIEFSIYNRWGERVFYTTQPGQCWDGTYKGVPQDPDVFVYMVKATTTCQPEIFRKGTFVLIR